MRIETKTIAVVLQVAFIALWTILKSASKFSLRYGIKPPRLSDWYFLGRSLYPGRLGARPRFEDAVKRSIVALGLSFALVGLAPGRGEEAGAVAGGRAIALKICANCHLAVEDQPQAPTLKPPATSFAEIAARPNMTKKFLRDFLMKPHGEARSASAMPAFLMPSREADAVIAYLMSLKAGK
jgi:mono/diheme cytochrome c family protein